MAAVTTTVTDERLLPLTLGVYGAWGSGKSSVILISRAVLEQDESILSVSFNGWQFEGYEDAKAALMYRPRRDPRPPDAVAEGGGPR